MDDIELNQVKHQWIREQCELKKQLITEDIASWDNMKEGVETNQFQLNFVGGVDISFVKGDDKHACAALVVLSFPELQVVYEDYDFVHLTSPYIPEFLAFREVSFLEDLISKLKKNKPTFLPQVIFVDGNGVLHPRGFGLASHLGVITNMCTIGVGKTLFQVDGIEKNSEHTQKINELRRAGEHFLLVGNSGATLGAALRSTDASKNPVYISVGHQISLETALRLSHSCCKHRVPEPIRQADMRSREFLRLRYENLLKTCCCQEVRGEAKNEEINVTEELEESLWRWCSLL